MRFPRAFPDPPPRKFSAFEWTRPLTKLNSNGESALILREQPYNANTARVSVFHFFWHQIRFNLKSTSGTRAVLHKNGHKRFRNVFQKWDFQSGSDVNKTRKVSSRFLPLSAKLSTQKQRIALFGHLCGKNEVETESGNLSSEFLGINRKTGEKVVMYTGDKTSCLIELRKRQ